jgi:hypothetical protein
MYWCSRLFRDMYLSETGISLYHHASADHQRPTLLDYVGHWQCIYVYAALRFMLKIFWWELSVCQKRLSSCKSIQLWPPLRWMNTFVTFHSGHTNRQRFAPTSTRTPTYSCFIVKTARYKAEIIRHRVDKRYLDLWLLSESPFLTKGC